MSSSWIRLKFRFWRGSVCSPGSNATVEAHELNSRVGWKSALPYSTITLWLHSLIARDVDVLLRKLQG
jgi:hypothetical protein